MSGGRIVAHVLAVLLCSGVAVEGAAQAACSDLTKDIDPVGYRPGNTNLPFASQALVESEVVWLMQQTGIAPEVLFGDNVRGRAKAIPRSAIVIDRAILTGQAPAGLTTVAAHEFGHLLQYRRSNRLLTSWARCELHADVLSGYLLRRHPFHSNEEGLIRALETAAKGDPASSPRRTAAILAGYRLDELSLDSVFATGETIVEQLIDGVDNQAQNTWEVEAKDTSAAARAALVLEHSAHTWSFDAAGPVVEVVHDYRNVSAGAVVLRFLVEMYVVLDDGTTRLVSSRGIQRRIDINATERFQILSRSHQAPGTTGSRVEVRLMAARAAAVVRP